MRPRGPARVAAVFASNKSIILASLIEQLIVQGQAGADRSAVIETPKADHMLGKAQASSEKLY